MKSKILFIDKKTNSPVSENDFVEVAGDRCPNCMAKIVAENETVVFENNSTVMCWMKQTGQVIKKCSCEVWLKLPYKFFKTE